MTVMRRFLTATLSAGMMLISAAAGTEEQMPGKMTGKAYKTAIFAGGCFWCVESDFDKIAGVISTISGYTGGMKHNPTYRQVVAGGTGHLEAVKITYDPKKVSYKRLVEYFWRTVDPTDGGGQFCDRGQSYTTAIFTATPAQKKIAAASKARLVTDKVLKRPIVTPIRDATSFYPAETYHQNYYRKNPIRYKYYRYSCGRNARIRAIWGNQAYGGVPHS
jgi:peptide-methionine (S)-S-oxide reductase